jgi:CopG family nickel-responsive transcriptional regulator
MISPACRPVKPIPQPPEARVDRHVEHCYRPLRQDNVVVIPFEERRVPLMTELVRTSVALEKDLCRRMDELVKESGVANRSEFLRDLLRRELVARRWQENREVVAAITLVYDHHVHDLQHRLTDLQHRYAGRIISSMHVHLSKDRCLEVVVVKAKGSQVKKLAYGLQGLKGVLHGGVTMTMPVS